MTVWDFADRHADGVALLSMFFIVMCLYAMSIWRHTR